MMKISRSLSCVLAATTILASISACASSTSANAASASAESVSLNAAASLTGKYEDVDSNAEWTEAESTQILLGTDLSVQGQGAEVQDGNVVISQAGTYVVSGTLSDGQIMVSANAQTDTVRIVLNGAQISCSDGAPIWVQSADQVVMILADGTENTLTDGEQYVLEEGQDEPNAVVFSESDLSFTGSGTLNIHANYDKGICTKDDLVITNGVLNITSVGDAVRGHDSVSIREGTFTITAGGDGIQSNYDSDDTKGWVAIDGGTFTITAENDGVQAETLLAVNAGTWNVTTGGGSENAETHTEDQMFGGGMQGTPREQRDANGDLTLPEDRMPTGENGKDPSQRPENRMPTENPTENNTVQTDAGENTTTDAAMEEADQESTSAKAFKAGMDVAINGGTIQVDAKDDAIHGDANVLIAEGTFTLKTGEDGIHADQELLVNGGTIDITESYEGLEGAVIEINGGDCNINASDDGVNAADGSTAENRMQESENGTNCSITINEGTLYVNADGDGLDANGSIYMNGGTVTVDGPTNGANSALDYDGSCVVTGGTFIAAGSSGMAQSISSDSTQAGLSVAYTETQAAGETVTIQDANGDAIVTYTPSKDYQHIVISAPSIEQGSAYSILAGETKVTDVTISSSVTNISSDGSSVSEGLHGGIGSGKEKNGQREERSTEAVSGATPTTKES